jgi:hypothetical protein
MTEMEPGQVDDSEESAEPNYSDAPPAPPRVLVPEWIHRDAASPILAAITEAGRHARGVSRNWCAGRPTVESGRVRISHWPSCDRPQRARRNP